MNWPLSRTRWTAARMSARSGACGVVGSKSGTGIAWKPNPVLGASPASGRGLRKTAAMDDGRGVITVLADAGPTVGLGHLSRAGAVAAALQAQGHPIETYVLGGQAVERDGLAWAPVADSAAPGHGPLLIDSYRVDVEAAAAARPVATFWDGVRPRPAGARLTIAFTDPDGPRHACLRPMFWGVAPRPVAPQVRRVLVAAGGGVTGGLDTLAAAGGGVPGGRAPRPAAARAAAPDAEVAALVGPSADVALPEGVAELRAPA